MKRIMTSVIIILIVTSCCLNIFAAQESDNYDDLEYLFDNQLTDSEISDLLNENYYNSNISKSDISGYPIMKLREWVFWNISNKPFEEFLSSVRDIEKKYFSSYVIFGEEIIKVRKVVSDDGSVKIGRAPLVTGNAAKEIDAPFYINELSQGKTKIVYDGEIYSIEEIYCFDGTTSQDGIVEYLVTNDGIFVEFFGDIYSEGIVFTEKDFRNLAKKYYSYTTSYNYNYNEHGEPLYGGRISFLDFVEKRPDREVTPTNNILIICIVCGVAVVIVSTLTIVLSYRKKKVNHT